jgi:5-methylcytosine-specific restriction endonuclease McrA
MAAYRRRWDKKNPDKVRAKSANLASKKRVSKWIANNPERFRKGAVERARRHYVLKKGATGSHTQAEWEAIVAKQNGRCADCGVTGRLTRDHVIPLSRGGSDFAFNIQGLCARCNSKKGARIRLGDQHSLFDKAVA